MSEQLDLHRIRAAIARIAASQQGVITTQQLIASGLSKSGIWDWVRQGRLHRIHRGVYAVGHPGLSIEGEWMAAVLAYGDSAVLSHRSAAMLWRMLERRRVPVHVSIASRNGRKRRDGIVLHRPLTLLPSQTTSELNIPVTKPDRTLSDLRRSGPEWEYRRAVRQAEFLRLSVGHLPEADGSRSGLESPLPSLLPPPPPA